MNKFKNFWNQLEEKARPEAYSARYNRIAQEVKSIIGPEALKSMDDDEFETKVRSYMVKLGIDGAGPVPNSLLARQDLETTKSRKPKSFLSFWKDQATEKATLWVKCKLCDSEVASMPDSELYHLDLYHSDKEYSPTRTGQFFEPSATAKSFNKSDQSQADQLMSADDRIWGQLGLRHGGDVDKNWASYVDKVAGVISGTVPADVWRIIEDQNHHSMIRAIQQLGRLGRDTGKSINKATIEEQLKDLKDQKASASSPEEQARINHLITELESEMNKADDENTTDLVENIKAVQIKRQKAELKARGKTDETFKQAWAHLGK